MENLTEFMGEFWPGAIAARPTCNDGSRAGAIVSGHQQRL